MQHIGILVPDVEKAAQWYIEQSGFTKKAEFMSGGSKVIFVVSKTSHVMCELIQRPDGSEEAKEVERMGGHVDHIAYEVEDIEKEFEKAQKNHLDVIEGIVQVPEFWENGFEYFLVHAATGEKVEYCRVK